MCVFVLSTAAEVGSNFPVIWSVMPFVVLLLSMALLPVINLHFWEKAYAWIAFGLAFGVALYYVAILKSISPLIHGLKDYVNFIALIGSLYVISGSIHLSVKGEATPLRNIIFLCLGAVLSNVVGTTGAAMLLIRPWIRMNKYRLTEYHIVFFIFIVCNVGGGLTPVGDPPLYIGFLKGVPFFWTVQNLFWAWLTTLGLLLAVFAVLDIQNFKRSPLKVRQEQTKQEVFKLLGRVHLIYLIGVLGCIFLPQVYHERVWLGVLSLPSAVMLILGLISYKTAQKEIHEKNDFNFQPVKEVAILFIGIFITMLPALAWLQTGGGVQLSSPFSYYLSCGTLSGCLDNAPTYLSFLAAAMGSYDLDVNQAEQVRQFLTTHPALLKSISCGAVFFGAMTYIGNGPNLMVKSIADQASEKVPHFIRYMTHYSLIYLLPILLVVGWLFF
jgi:Na+/H+ antiporter NhaD/arsenite permease-like protein